MLIVDFSLYTVIESKTSDAEAMMDFLLELVLYFSLDENENKLAAVHSDLAALTSLVIGDEHDLYGLPKWHSIFQTIVNALCDVPYMKRAKLLDVVFSELPKRARSDQIRYFCYYKLIIDYLEDQTDNFHIKIKEERKKNTKKVSSNPSTDSYSESIEMFDIYCENFPPGKGLLDCMLSLGYIIQLYPIYGLADKNH